MSHSLPASVITALMKEIAQLTKTPLEGISIMLNHADADNLSNIYATIDGPECTPFENGVFKIKLSFSSNYPSHPPKAYFLTKVFHPNVSQSTGEICVNTLKRDWSPSNGLKHILMVIRCLLIHPNPESALNEEAGKMLLEAYEEYERRARLMTRIHAQKSDYSKIETNALNDSTNTNDSPSKMQNENKKPNAAEPAKTVNFIEKKALAAKKKSMRRL